MKEWRWLISGIVLFACATTWAVQSNPYSLQPDVGYETLLGDLDGDRDIDALVTVWGRDSEPAITLWINQGGLQGNTQGKFNASIQTLGDQGSRSAVIGDLDQDGDLDVLIGKASGFEVFLNSGGPQGGWQGSFQPHGREHLLKEGDELQSIALGDLDQDGDLDAWIGLCCTGSAGSLAWLNDGKGSFTESNQVSGEPGSRQVALGDLDGDEDQDMVIVVESQSANIAGSPDASNSIQVWLNQGEGRFFDSGQQLAQDGPRLAALGDLDGNNELDAIITGRETTSIWINDGAGHFINGAQLTGRIVAQAIILGDLDQDRDLDILLSSGDVVEVWRNDGDGAFELSAQRINLPKYSAAALGDLDGDGDLDLFSGYSNKRYQIWWNDGFGRLGLSWR